MWAKVDPPLAIMIQEKCDKVFLQRSTINGHPKGARAIFKGAGLRYWLDLKGPQIYARTQKVNTPQQTNKHYRTNIEPESRNGHILIPQKRLVQHPSNLAWYNYHTQMISDIKCFWYCIKSLVTMETERAAVKKKVTINQISELAGHLK